MKRTSIKITLVLIALMCCFCVFADGVKEVKNVPLKQYLEKLQNYKDDYDKYINQVKMAFDMGDMKAYYTARKNLKELQAPVLTKDECNSIANDIAKNNDIESAKLLFQYSAYYRPRLNFVCDQPGYSYQSQITVCPGEEVTLPKFDIANSVYTLKGWGYSEGSVDFVAGDKITMPVKDTTLYAVFDVDPSLTEGKNLAFDKLKVNGKEALTVPQGKVFEFSFEVKNDGTERLDNVEICFDSDDPLLVVLNNTAKTRYITTRDSRIVTFQVITKAKSGTKLNGEITVKDSDSKIWTQDVTFTVE